MKRILRLITERDGATAVEYAVMLGMVILTAMTSIGLVGTRTNGLWRAIGRGLSSAFGS